MPQESAPLGGSRPMPSAGRVVEEFLWIHPHLEEYRSALAELATRAWRGEHPFRFYFQDVAPLLRDVSWLVAPIREFVDPAFSKAILKPGYFKERLSHITESQSGWPEREGLTHPQNTRSFRHLEGLLLLSKVHWGPEQNEDAHKLLRRVIDQIDHVVQGGKSKRLVRHPLKDLLQKIGNPQTTEQLADSLNALLPEVGALYPRVATFLEEAYLPLACRTPVIWQPPSGFDERDVLDAHLPAQEPPISWQRKGIGTAHAPVAERRKIKPFSVENLADEMLVIQGKLSPRRAELVGLGRAWRGEDTWQFMETIPRLAWWLKWIRPLLGKWVEQSLVKELSAATSSDKWRSYSRIKRNEWRERNYLERMPAETPTALFSPPGPPRDRNWGVDHLRGCLLIGRLEWGPESNLPIQDSLADVINEIEKARDFEQFYEKGTFRKVVHKHPLKAVLDQIERPETVTEFVDRVEKLLPQIAAVHSGTAQVLGDAYLPLLKGDRVDVGSRPPPPEKKPKTRRHTKKRAPIFRSRARRERINIRTHLPRLPGESIEESSAGKQALQRIEPSAKAVSLREELRWAHQRVWGSNPLLVRDHIESLSDAEAILFAKALDSQICSAISSSNVTNAWLGILVALTLVTGQHVRTWTQISVRLTEGKRISWRNPTLLLQSAILRLPVLRPEDAFEPTDEMRSMLEATYPTIDLHLPPTLRLRIRSLLELSMAGWSKDEEDLRKSLETYIAKLEPSVGTGLSLARVRLVARARLREATDDLAATMILTGDTFGCSTAPLYYGSLQRKKLEESYRDAMWPLFGDRPSNTLKGETKRIGSQLLVSGNAARSLARSPAAPMHASGKRSLSHKYLVSDHNSLVNHTASMVMAAAGHRPTNALFELTRFDFDTRVHSAIFWDKQCDPAHLFRYVPVADIVSIQIENLLQHLRGLLEVPHLPASTKDHVSDVLCGKSPLFFHISSDLQPIRQDISEWSDGLPKNWRIVPLNWGRTLLASRGRDAGIKPDHLAIVLGHLEAAGYPYSNDSPLEPAALSREISGALGSVARSAGWVARKGLKPTRGPAAPVDELGPLRNWTRERKALADDVKAFELEQKRVSRAELRGKRSDGETLALAALVSVTARAIPSFDALSQPSPGNNASAPGPELQREPPIAITLSDLERIQEHLNEATKHDPVLKIAAHNALHRYLKLASKQLEWDCLIPGPWLVPATLEPAPFFPGMLRATSQLHALREAFAKIPRKPSASSSFSAFEWACGLSAVAMCIFNFVERPDQIVHLLEQRMSGVRCRTLDDLLFVQDGKNVVGVRGIAAIAVARLAKRYPNDAVPPVERLDLILAAQLPAALIGEADKLLERLCATVSVANITELSGLARMALDPKTGSRAMSILRQRQMLEEGCGAEKATHADGSKGEEDFRIVGKKRGTTIARAQYRKLCEILHIGEGPKVFPLTNEELSQANIVAFRNPLIRALTAYLQQEDLSPVVACIAAFALHMTTHGTREAKSPAWVTIHNYITCFGAGLVEQAGDLEFLDLEAEDYIDIYQAVIDGKSGEKQRATATREIVDFQAYLEAYHDLEPVDLSDLEGARLSDTIEVDAEIIQPQEYLMGLEILSAQAALNAGDHRLDTTARRLARQAEVFALLLRGSGARINELAALRFKDILATLEFTLLLVRPSRFRRLKTRAARRIIDLSLRLTRRQRRLVAEWLDAEKSRLGASWKPTLPIFGKLGVPKERVASADLRNLTLQAFDDVVGSRTKIHRARHLVANEDMLGIWFSERDWQALRRVRLQARRRVPRHVVSRVVLPRDLRRVTLRFGHRRPSTTIANYFHMAWATTSRAAAALEQYTNRHVGALAVGVSAAGADKIIQRASLSTSDNKRLGWNGAWLQHVWNEAPRLANRVATNSKGQLTRTRGIGARYLERVLRDIQRGVPPPQVCSSHGLTYAQLEVIRKLTAEIEYRTGFKIWPSEGTHSKRLRAARKFERANWLEKILDIADEASGDSQRDSLVRISQAYLTWSVRGSRELFQWPTRDAVRFVNLLVNIGCPAELIECRDLTTPEGFVEISVRRRPEKSDEEKRITLNHEIAWLLVTVHIAIQLGLG